MKNIEKVMDALVKAFPGHKVDLSYNFNEKIYAVFIDDDCVGYFEDRFCDEDFDNPEIEIKVKAPLKSFENFINNDGYTSYMRLAVEEGVKKWEKESQQNS